MKRIVVIALALIGLAVASWGQGESKHGDLYKKDTQAAVEAQKSGDAKSALPAFLKLHSDFLESSRVTRNLAWMAQKAGNQEQAAAFLKIYALMGTTLPEGGPIYKTFADAGMLEKVPELKRNAEAVKTGSLVFTLSDANLIAEDIGYDPATKHFFLSSVHEKKVLECDAAGKCEDVIHALPDMPLDALLALHVDAARGVLWVTSAGLNAETDFKAEYDGRSAILKFDLRTHKLIRRFEPGSAGKHALGDMTVAANGDVYVSDGTSGDVYVIRNGGTSLQSLAPAGNFVSPQTPALNEDESLLYVPDYSNGIGIINLKSGAIDWVRWAHPAALEGIDGMYWTKEGLIAVQNGTSPERIVRFHLVTENIVDEFKVLEANWNGLGDPTHGVMVGNDFYYIVNSGWDRVGDDGVLKPGTAAAVWKMRIGNR